MMKVKLVIIATATMLFFVLPSCKKTEAETKETINLVDSILPTDTFVYTLPVNLSDDPYQITTQAKHFLKSELSTDANGNTIYTYIYSANGENLLTDDVVIANVEETHPSGSHPKGPHPGGPKHHCDSTEVERTINIHFVIK